MNVMGMETIWTASVNQTCVTTLEKIFINMKPWPTSYVLLIYQAVLLRTTLFMAPWMAPIIPATPYYSIEFKW